MSALSFLDARLWAVVASWAAGGVAVASATGDCFWLSRAGAFIVATGVLMDGWPMLRRMSANSLPAWWEDRDVRALKNITLAVALGTILNGTGDLIANAVLCGRCG